VSKRFDGRPRLAGGFGVKKVLVLAAAAAAGFAVWRKIQNDKLEQDLWTEATNEAADLR
jgi:hypothetical protein